MILLDNGLVVHMRRFGWLNGWIKSEGDKLGTRPWWWMDRCDTPYGVQITASFAFCMESCLGNRYMKCTSHRLLHISSSEGFVKL